MNTFLNVAICEDNPSDQQVLSQLIDQSVIPARCSSYSSGEAFLADFSPGAFDLIFIDIYMQGLNGVETLEKIRAADRQVMVAFTTTSLDHTLAGYRLGALKYLEKPVTAKDVSDSLRLAVVNRDSIECISLLIGGKHLSIPIEQIHYFEQHNHAILVHMADKTLQTSQTVRMDAIEERLQAHSFLRTHKSYLVNLAHVVELDLSFCDFVMGNGGRASVRARDKRKIRDEYETYLFSAAREHRL